MSGGRRFTLNMEADARPGDPTAVSDPACWITGAAADALRGELKNRFGRDAYTYREDVGVMDLSADPSSTELTSSGPLSDTMSERHRRLLEVGRLCVEKVNLERAKAEEDKK